MCFPSRRLVSVQTGIGACNWTTFAVPSFKLLLLQSWQVVRERLPCYFKCGLEAHLQNWDKCNQIQAMPKKLQLNVWLTDLPNDWFIDRLTNQLARTGLVSWLTTIVSKLLMFLSHRNKGSGEWHGWLQEVFSLHRITKMKLENSELLLQLVTFIAIPHLTKSTCQALLLVLFTSSSSTAGKGAACPH